MNSKLPARIDRATFERLLQRAAELQAASSDIGDGVSEEELLALGKEVGIPEQHLRQALLEERAQVAPAAPETLADDLFGRADLVAERVVQGTEESIAAALANFLESREHLVVQRTAIGRTTFEPMSPFAGAMRKMRRIFEGAGKPYLEHAELVTAIVTPLETGFCHVTLAVSMKKARRAYMIGGTAMGTGGVAIAALMIVLAAPPLAALIPILPLGGGGWLIAKQFRPIAMRAQLGLELALDELERRPAIGSGTRQGQPETGRIAREVGQVVRDITTEVRKALEEK